MASNSSQNTDLVYCIFGIEYLEVLKLSAVASFKTILKANINRYNGLLMIFQLNRIKKVDI